MDIQTQKPHDGRRGVHFAISDDGTLAFVEGLATNDSNYLGIVGSDGRQRVLEAPPAAYRALAISPDGRQVALESGTEFSANIFVYDLDGETELRQLTFEGSNMDPTWTPDGEWITYSSNRDGSFRIYRQRADGSGAPEPLTPAGPTDRRQPHWSPDGELLAYVGGDAASNSDIWLLNTADGESERIVDLPNDQVLPFRAGAPGSRRGDSMPDSEDMLVTLRLGEPGDEGASAQTRIVIVQNWFEELKRLVPVQ